jgi:CheY-like chemotaxis protein
MGEAVQRRPLMAHVQPNESRLFVSEPPAIRRSEIPAAATDIVADEKVIVLADDSISVRKFVGRMLEKAGYRVKLASDGLEALEIVRRSTCNLLITDLEMPRTNGFELLGLLQEEPQTSHIPVIVVTARAGAKYREHALGQGAAAFLIKPVQEEQLVSLVRELTSLKQKKRKSAAAGVRIGHAASELARNHPPERNPQNPVTDT